MNIPLPTSTVSIISANVTSLISDFAPVVTLIIGILLALFVLQVIIDIIRK